MRISAIQRFTLLDFPEKIACIVFTAGCDFRCGYCHNPEFVLPEQIARFTEHFIDQEQFFTFLTQRQELLDGVVISGGEPTLMPDLLDFIRNIKKFGFLVKLDTNGNRPQILETALQENLLDYVAMDVKTSLAEYPTLVGPCVLIQNISKSIAILKKAPVPSEFRTTFIQEIHTPQVIQDMVSLLSGSKTFFLQTFRPGITLSPAFAEYHPFSASEMEDIANQFRPTVTCVSLR